MHHNSVFWMMWQRMQSDWTNKQMDVVTAGRAWLCFASLSYALLCWPARVYFDNFFCVQSCGYICTITLCRLFTFYSDLIWLLTCRDYCRRIDVDVNGSFALLCKRLVFLFDVWFLLGFFFLYLSVILTLHSILIYFLYVYKYFK